MNFQVLIIFALTAISYVLSKVPAGRINPASWMSDSLEFIGQKTLKEITLPGTHDSGAYWLGDVWMPDAGSDWPNEAAAVGQKIGKNETWVTRNFALAQDQNLYQQLLGGIRYLDIRSGWDNTTNQWVTFHYLCGSPITELFGNISKFMEEYKNEILVLEVSHFSGFPSHQNIRDLRAMIIEYFGEFIYPVNLSFNFTINDMIESGKTVIVTMSEEDSAPIWPGDTIYNTYANSPIIRKMIKFNKDTVQQYMSSTWPNQIFKVSWTLTPNAQTILDSIKFLKPHTLIQLADLGNPFLPEFWKSLKHEHYQVGNILIIDHYEQSSIMAVIYDMNGITF
ncbi:unnamed protein product [Blepharisma stoltei]|uniref:Uncharacterized protein n=1 Tax=Blepharisma stoltei TaxID=1481888 RepID=A0AAU9IPI5_9CILI|nr:unnamed protein product [Blepharisma stoltei]